MLSSLIQRLNERRAAEFELEGSADAGFTLIELMVVLLILAILLAIAIPTFLGVTGGANDRAAQSNLNTSLTTAKAAETQNSQTYTGITAASLHGNEPSVTFSTSAVTTPGPVSVFVSTDGYGIVMAGYSKSTDKCWYAVDNIAGITDISSANGLYQGSTAYAVGPPVVGTDASTGHTPTLPGTYYGKSVTNSGATGCDASAVGVGVVGGWGTKFPAS
jgi:type IV pilus assembly protein PilA